MADGRMADAKQFDGTFGSAKEIVGWAKHESVVCGASPDATDKDDGGLNLFEEKPYTDPETGDELTGPHYTTINAGDWVVKVDDRFTTLPDSQFRMIYPDFGRAK